MLCLQLLFLYFLYVARSMFCQKGVGEVIYLFKKSVCTHELGSLTVASEILQIIFTKTTTKSSLKYIEKLPATKSCHEIRIIMSMITILVNSQFATSSILSFHGNACDNIYPQFLIKYVRCSRGTIVTNFFYLY